MSCEFWKIYGYGSAQRHGNTQGYDRARQSTGQQHLYTEMFVIEQRSPLCICDESPDADLLEEVEAFADQHPDNAQRGENADTGRGQQQLFYQVFFCVSIHG